MMGNGMMAVDANMMGRMMTMMGQHSQRTMDPEGRQDVDEMQGLMRQMLGDQWQNGFRNGMMRGNGVQ